MNHWLAYQLSRDNGFEAKQLSMFTMMLMLMMLMMMRKEQLPTFFLVRDSDGHINCELQACRPRGFLRCRLPQAMNRLPM